MWNPFRRRDRAEGGRVGLLNSFRRGGAYTIETPDIGAGHYLFDPGANCDIHGNRLEAWCDIDDEGRAREELHWHSLMLSEAEIDPEQIRKTTNGMIQGRLERRAAERKAEHETRMSKLEGSAESLDRQVAARQEAAAVAARHEETQRREAEVAREERAAKRQRYEELPRRSWVSVTLTLTVSVSVSFFVFDLGLIGAAFELISGAPQWKATMALGVALAPLSTAIGIAAWLSASEHPVREGKGAGRLALVTGLVAIAGLLLVTVFRAAVLNEEVLGAFELSFLSLMQVGLAMAETMLYTVYFDSKLGRDLKREIEALEEQAEKLERAADVQARNRVGADEQAAGLERQVAADRALLRRESALHEEIESAENGVAGILRGVVETAILEGEMARKRKERRPQHSEPAPRRTAAGVAYAALGVAFLALLANSQIGF
jgi:peptidoglycan hydrolase CwlO-like protein